MKNKYPGCCDTCGADVDTGEGTVSKIGGRWVTFCEDHPFVHARKLCPDGRVVMPYEPQNLPVLRSMPGARWDGNYWQVSVSDADLVETVRAAEALKLGVPGQLYDRLRDAAKKAEQEKAHATDRVAEISAENPGLYPFQAAGIAHLETHARALLADEMGLGKTVQAAVAMKGQNWPVLVVCPASLKLNWAREIKKWAPGYKTTILAGRKSMRWPEAGEAVILNYDILRDDLGKIPEDCLVIFDEVQYIKNYKSARAKRAAKIAEQAKRVWALTGTPMMGRPFDLWGILRQTGMANRVFGGFKQFLKFFLAYKNKWGGYEFSTPGPEVAERLRRVMLRRRREEVLPDLPKKRFQEIEVNQIPRHLSKKMDKLAESLDLTASSLPAFSEFSEIRAKLAEIRIPAMIETVEGYEDSETPLIVFSAHRAPVDELESREGWAIITGDTPGKERQETVDLFQAGKLKGIGLTIAAGGVGINLTAASHLLFVDLDWTPANNAQAEDRACRIGQNADSVLVKRMVSAHPLDRHIQKLLVEKAEMISATIEV